VWDILLRDLDAFLLAALSGRNRQHIIETDDGVGGLGKSKEMQGAIHASADCCPGHGEIPFQNFADGVLSSSIW
jgi:hypothetical protein